MSTTTRQRVLLTGAAGRVTALIEPDLARDYDLVLTDAHVPDNRRDDISPLDLLEFGAVLDAMQGVDQVIHLAIASRRALNHLPPHEYADEEMRTNVMGTQHVFEAAAQAGVKRIVYFSSMTVLMGYPTYEHVERDTPVRPRGLYGCTKLFGEYLGEYYTRKHDMSVICLRLGQPVPIPDWEYGSSRVREFATNGLHVDAADVILGVRCALTTSLKHHIFNLVSAPPKNNIDLSAGLEIGYWPTRTFTEKGEAIANPTPRPEPET